MDQIKKLYIDLKKKYGEPRGQWLLWCKRPKTERDKEEIAIGSILTQRTNWKNVEKAIENLKTAEVLSFSSIYRLGNQNINSIEELIRSSGFYKQKAVRLFKFCEFIIKNYNSLKSFLKQDVEIAQRELLSLSGIGPETADSILLYAGEKPVFVIDEYSKRLIKKQKLTCDYSYHSLQKLFEKNLVSDYRLYQDFHALIVIDGKKKSAYNKTNDKRFI